MVKKRFRFPFRVVKPHGQPSTFIPNIRLDHIRRLFPRLSESDQVGLMHLTSALVMDLRRKRRHERHQQDDTRSRP